MNTLIICLAAGVILKIVYDIGYDKGEESNEDIIRQYRALALSNHKDGAK